MSTAVFAVIVAALASAIGGGSVVLPSILPAERTQLARDLDLAQSIIDERDSSAPPVAVAGQFEQLATWMLRSRSRSVGQPRRAP